MKQIIYHLSQPFSQINENTIYNWQMWLIAAALITMILYVIKKEKDSSNA